MNDPSLKENHDQPKYKTPTKKTQNIKTQDLKAKKPLFHQDNLPCFLIMVFDEWRKIQKYETPTKNTIYKSRRKKAFVASRYSPLLPYNAIW